MKKLLLLLNKARLPFAKCQKILSAERAGSIPVDRPGGWDEFDFLTAGEKDRLRRGQIERFSEIEMEKAQTAGVEIIDLDSPAYPPLLKEIATGPLVLYVKGEVEILKSFCLAIVGTRLPTLYGIDMAKKFSYALSSLGITVVSGLARGIDHAAHQGALAGGKTIAVLGSGLNHVYPKENEKLSRLISRRGALVSEFPLDEGPRKEYFPQRNRIVSGLSRGVLVVEAALRSGALITAGYALEQNREVFALPGQANSPKSRGTHKLIKEGAGLIDSLEDILGTFSFGSDTIGTERMVLSDAERGIFNIMGSQPVTMEEMLIRQKGNTAAVNEAVLSLQIKGLIREMRPLCYVKAEL